MADMKQNDPAETVLSRSEEETGTVSLGSVRRRQWTNPAANADDESERTAVPDDPASPAAAFGLDGFESDPGPEHPARTGLREPRPFIVAATVCAVLLCAIAAMLWVVLSSHGRTQISTVAANPTTSSADSAAAAPFFSQLTPTPSARRSPSATARASSAPAQRPAAARQRTAPPSPSPSSSPPALVGDWPLAAPASGSDTVADIAGSHPGTASGVQWSSASNVGDYGVFDGADSVISIPGPILDTGPGGSFTVSAWLYLVQNDTSGTYMTAVSQDGSSNSGFYLQYSGVDNRWAFTLPGSPARAESTGAPALNTWTHVVGVYDAADGQERLYVGGALEDTVTDSGPVASGGSLVIGRGEFQGNPVDWFLGDIRDVEVFDRALTTSQVDSMR